MARTAESTRRANVTGKAGAGTCLSVDANGRPRLRDGALGGAPRSEQVLRRLTRIQGVGSIRSNIVLNCLKSSTEMPLGHLKR